MTTRRESKNGNLNHPSPPALCSVPSPKRLTEKERHSLFKKDEKTLTEKNDATQKLDNDKSKSSIEYELNLPVLPHLPCTVASDPPKAETICPSIEDIGREVQATENDASKLDLINSDKSGSKKLKLPKVSPLRSVPVKAVPRKEINQQLGRRVKAISEPYMKKSQCIETERSNIPNRPTLRSTAAIWRLGGHARNSPAKRVPQRNARKENTLLIPNTSIPEDLNDDNRRTDPSSVSAPQRTTAKEENSTYRNAKQKTARKRSNSVKRPSPNPQESNDESLKSHKPVTGTSSTVLKKRRGRTRASATNRNERKTFVDIDPSLPPSKGKSKGLNGGKRSQTKLSPKPLPLPIPASSYFRSYQAGESSTKKVTSSSKMGSKRKRRAQGSMGHVEEASRKKVRKDTKPGPKKISAVTDTGKNERRSRSIPVAQSQMKKGTPTNETAPSTIGYYKSHTAYLPSSSSSDSDLSRESDGSYTSASSEESERKVPGMLAPAAPKGSRDGDVNADDKRSKKDESLQENAKAPESTNTNTGKQEGQLSRSHLQPKKGIAARTSKSMVYKPSKHTALKRLSVADIGKADNVRNGEEQESRSTKRRRRISQQVNWDTSDSRSYAEQLKAAGQDISGGGFPIRYDSSESDKDE